MRPTRALAPAGSSTAGRGALPSRFLPHRGSWKPLPPVVESGLLAPSDEPTWPRTGARPPRNRRSIDIGIDARRGLVHAAWLSLDRFARWRALAALCTASTSTFVANAGHVGEAQLAEVFGQIAQLIPATNALPNPAGLACGVHAYFCSEGWTGLGDLTWRISRKNAGVSSGVTQVGRP